MRNFRNWEVYQNAKAFMVKVYESTEGFPDSEKFGTINQIRRAAVSTVANNAEGAGRPLEKDFRHFLSISIGSALELEALIEVSHELKFLNESQTQQQLSDLTIIQKQLNAFIAKLKASS